MNSEYIVNNDVYSVDSYFDFLKCPKLFWYRLNQFEDCSETPQFSFISNPLNKELILEYLSEIYPDAVNLYGESSEKKISEITINAIKNKGIVFMGGILANSTFIPFDIIAKHNNGYLELKKIKIASRFKKSDIHELAYKVFMLNNLGVNVDKIEIIYIEKKYIKDGKINKYEMLNVKDVTLRVQDSLKDVRRNFAKLLKTAKRKNEPQKKLGIHCVKPQDCPYKKTCWHDVPERNIFILTGADRWKKCNILMDMGILRLKDVPDNFNLTFKQGIQIECEKNNRIFIDKEQIREFLNRFEYPIHFIDFEAMIDIAVPLFNGTKPFQQIPFQFSLHIMAKNNLKHRHFSFLADSNEDPRYNFLKELKSKIKDEGSIVCFSTFFEKKILKETANAFPEFKEWVNDLLPRFIDIMEPFKNYYLYHPQQNGNISLKKILPVYTDISYDELIIKDAVSAAQEYTNLTFTKSNPSNLKNIRKNLEKYCHLDTMAMIELFKMLIEYSK